MRAEREIEHITYEGGTGRRSKEVETYNFHKEVSVLAEHGFDCIRIQSPSSQSQFRHSTHL